MDEQLQRRVQRYGWDRAAEYYERYWRKQLEPAHEELLDMIALQPGDRVLDAACGSGWVTFQMAEQVGLKGTVLGTDISDNMIELARRLAGEKKVTNATFERMDAEGLKVSAGAFDAATCALGLMYVPDVRKALAGFFAALRPGGRAAAAVWGARSRCGWAEIFPIVESKITSEVCPLFFQLGSGATLETAFHDSGFINLRSMRISTELIYKSGEDACGAAFAGGPVALAYSRFDAKTREVAEVEYLQSIEHYLDGSTYRVPGEFVITVGAKPMSQ